MNVLLIINETAGIHQPEEFEALLSRATGAAVECIITEGSGHATEIVKNHAAGKVLVAGGDDTVREVIAGLGDASLGIIPTGSFNIFARSLGVPLDPLEAFDAALRGPDKRVDLGMMDELRFNESAGVGLVAEAFARAPEQSVKGLSRWWAAARAAFAALTEVSPRTYHLTLDGEEEFTLEALNITVANVGLFAAGVPWLPQADPCDGWLDIAVLPGEGVLDILKDLPAAFHPEQALGRLYRAKRVDIRTEAPAIFRYDGLVTGLRAKVEIRCLPGALKVCNAGVD